MSQQTQADQAFALPATKRKPWQWVPTAYFYQAIPNTVMQSLIVYFYIAMNVNPKVSGIAVSLLYLPWFIKPLWGPIVDILKTKKWWAMWMQIVVASVSRPRRCWFRLWVRVRVRSSPIR